MFVNDPLADMLSRIRNANLTFADTVEIPASKMKLALARILKDQGYIKNFRMISDPHKPYSEIKIYLAYSSNDFSDSSRKRVIQGLKRISKPGRRIYVRHDNIPVVMGGLGIAVLSTSKGLKTSSDALKDGLGGEVLCYVW